jgi:hypothetical protein
VVIEGPVAVRQNDVDSVRSLPVVVVIGASPEGANVVTEGTIENAGSSVAVALEDLAVRISGAAKCGVDLSLAGIAPLG